MKFLMKLGDGIPHLKLDLKMKLSIYLFLLSLFQIHANSYSQSARISLDLNEVTIENVLSEIESQSEFKFLYNSKEIDYKKRVSVKFKKTKIDKILSQLFSNTNIGFEVMDKQIVLVSKTVKTKTAAQLLLIEGNVVDETGFAVAGASVVVKGTTRGAVTDFDGTFKIEAAAGDILQVSFLGYETSNVTVTDETTIKITLKEDASQLDEVVVIGYGSSRRGDLIEAVTQVSAESFEDQPVTRVEEALQGRTAGVTVARANGAPGAAAKIRVRGVNSITGNNAPLVVIDGFIGADLRTLNPNDIETFDVLKDASATAIYGSRGANGVILITTKRGKGKPTLNFESFISVSELARSYDNRLSALEYYDNVNNPALFPFTTRQDLIDNPVPDREDELFRTAYAQNYQLSVGGGTDNVNYFVSGNYTNQEGIMITNAYERFSLRANVEAKISDKLKVGVKTFYNREIDDNNPNALNRAFGGPVVRTLAFDPTFRIFNPDGSFNYNPVTTGGSSSGYFVTNLYRSAFERKANRFNATFNLDYNILPELKYSVIAGANVLNQVSSSLRIESPGNGADFGDNNGSILSNNNTSYQISNIINWNKTYGKHTIDATGVYEFTRAEGNNNGFIRRLVPFSITNFSLLSDLTLTQELQDLGITNTRETLDIRSGSGRSAIQSLLARVKYSFDGSLSLSASIRRDETTAFTRDQKFGVFKSFSAGYSFNKLAFVQDSDVINNLKFRASWGETGNQNAPRAAFDDAFTTVTLPNPSGGVLQFQKQTRVGNPNLTWETTEQANIGLDAGFLNGRINLSLDVFQKKTRDLIVTTLLNENVPGTFITDNVGDVENKGFEVLIESDIIKNENLTWSSSLNFTYLQNEVVTISPTLRRRDFIEGTFQDVGLREPINVIKVGEPLGSFWGTRFLGFDENGDPVSDNTKQIIGSGLPTSTWGFNNRINYKNWVFNLFIQGAAGFEVFNQVEAALAGGNPSFNGVLKSDKALVQGIGLNSSRYVEKGDFIRLSNLSVGYTFNNPTNGINSINVYGSGQNLFLITDYGGYDPEISSSQSIGTASNADVSSGIDSGAIPNPRVFTLGVKVGL